MYIGVYILCADKFIMVTDIVQNLWPVLRSVIYRSQDSSDKALMLTSWQTQLHGWVHHATKMALKFDTFIQQQWWWAVLVFDFRTKNVLFQGLNLACRMFFHLQIRSEKHFKLPCWHDPVGTSSCMLVRMFSCVLALKCKLCTQWWQSEVGERWCNICMRKGRYWQRKRAQKKASTAMSPKRLGSAPNALQSMHVGTPLFISYSVMWIQVMQL